mmetsp:Transcript_97814/g.277255  ORF Transcript_97814/g.277255 Transcript_97814/m.277255 type:complete len:640 (-) Transcript_97814:185-2104(-)
MAEGPVGGCGPAPAAPTHDGVALAPIVDLEAAEPIQMRDIDAGPIDYAIRCTRGRFAGRFIYVNRTPQGELFGSDKSSKDVTMYIENASLSPKHAEIKFNSQSYQYFLRDSASSDGTWVRIRWNRSIEIAPGQELKVGDTVIEVKEGPAIPAGEEEVKQWLAAYQLQHLASRLREEGVLALRDIHDRGCALLEPLLAGGDLPAEERAGLEAAVAEVDKMWPSGGYPGHALEFSLRPAAGGEEPAVAVITWEGGTIALAPSGEAEGEFDEELEAQGSAAARQPKDVTRGTAPVTGWEKCEWLRVGYSFGRYYVHLSERSAESAQKGWVRLRQNQSHWLQPHDLFRIGSLEFTVLRFNAAVYSEQGFRATMEDEDILLQDLATSNWRHCSFFGIYDGHGGRDCVSFVRQRLHINIVAALHAKGGLDKSSQVHHDMYESLVQGFRETDRQFLNMAQALEGFNGGSGCAAVVACVVGGWVWCANVGDSRALLCRDGRAIQLSLDHKPDREDEKRRIEDAGAFVSWGRVNGRLALSRAFGDVDCKTQVSKRGELPVTAEPEIRAARLTPEDEFLLLACDGVFDVFSSQEAVDFIYARLAAMPQNEQDPQRAVQDIVHEAIHDRRSRDNVTALLVTFRRAIIPRR